MKKKNLIFGGIGLVGAYYFYQVFVRKIKIDRVHKELFKKKQANDYKDSESCRNAGYNWGVNGMPGPDKKATCFTNENRKPV